MQQQTCPSGGTTSVTGSVFAPNGVDVLPGALVYVPNAALSTFQDGVTTPHCACEDDVSGSPLVSTVTAFDGTFTLNNMPVGASIPLVIQKGRWRRLYTIPNVAACTSTAIPASGAQQLRMPQKEAEFTPYDNIPLMGFVTGSVDALECVLRKVGIADSQFSDPTGTGRVRFYKGSGSAGSKYSKNTPSETTLWGSAAAIDAYDIVYFACQGDDYEKTAAQHKVVVDYADAGGRVFATHYSYVWLTNTADNATWSPTAQWTLAEGFFNNDPGVGLINVASTDPRPTLLAQWLQFIKASTTLRPDEREHAAAGLRGGQRAVAALDQRQRQGRPRERAAALHVRHAVGRRAGEPVRARPLLRLPRRGRDRRTAPPSRTECTSTTMTPQEKMLEFMIFDLGSCVSSTPTCTPTSCSAQGVTCGPIGDGCGNILQCGMCPSGQACIAGQCATTCTPITKCPANVACGSVSDGCGGVIDCGLCPSGACNNGSCTAGGCTPITSCPRGHELRDDQRRVQRHHHLRDVHGPADLRRRGHAQRVRRAAVHAEDLRGPALQLRHGDRRLRPRASTAAPARPRRPAAAGPRPRRTSAAASPGPDPSGGLTP